MLTVKHLSFEFPGRKIFDDITFHLQTGAVTCLLGGNGSGKTTLFNIIGGFLRPAVGIIRLGDAEITGRAPFRISRLGVARTFQDLRLIGRLSVRQNILLSLSNQRDERLMRSLFFPISTPERSNEHLEKTDILLKEFFLEDVAEQLASDISYGQQKLLTLACCTALDARLLLLDEPVAGISPEYRERIGESLAKLRAAAKTILLIEHQPDFLKRVGNHFLFLEGRQIHSFRNLNELNSAPVEYGVLN